MILSFNSSSNLFFCDFVLKGIGEEKGGRETSNYHRNANEVNALKGYSLEFTFLLFFCYKAINSRKKKQTFRTFAES